VGIFRIAISCEILRHPWRYRRGISWSIRWLLPVLFVVRVSQETNHISLVFPPLARSCSHDGSSRPVCLMTGLLNVKLYGPTVCTRVLLIRDLHGNGKSSHPHPLPQKLYPSPSVPIRHGFHPHPFPQHLTSTPIHYRNTFFSIPKNFPSVLQRPKLIGLVGSSNTNTWVTQIHFRQL